MIERLAAAPDARASGPNAGHIPGHKRGDHDLNPGFPPVDPLTAAAVLVPLVARAQGITVLLTQRTAHLSAHAGQISFPGGHSEPEDADGLATALRETREEIGLAPEHVQVLGRLDTYVTGTGFEIEPVVGLLRPPFRLEADPHEVAEIFEVPLDFILDPGNRARHSVQWKGQFRRFYVIPYENRFIWGATAGMLVDLAERLS